MFFSLMSCGRKASTVSENKNPAESAVAAAKADSFTDVTRKTRVWDVINDPVFGDYGRLIFPGGPAVERRSDTGRHGRSPDVVQRYQTG